MACLELDSSQLLSTLQSFYGPMNSGLEDSITAECLTVSDASTSSPCHVCNIPQPPPLPKASHCRISLPHRLSGYTYVPDEIRHAWDRLFIEGYEADVCIITDDNSPILAHSSILAVTSPVLKNMLEHASNKGGFRCVKISGMPLEAIRLFLRFLYSACYRPDDMKKFVLHLLVMSHVFSIPSLKKACISQLEDGFLNTENVIDVLQLAQQCDAPRLSLLCTRLIIKDFKIVSVSEGWKIMKQGNPSLEQELLEALVEADSRMQEKIKIIEEKKMYMQLYEAMEALLHICRDGCRTIGPRDKLFKDSQAACNFPACKGIELLVRHFSGCKTQVPGGCAQCKRMWQLFELHSWMCNEPDSCKVPLCRHFKDKMQSQTRKEELKWKMLVSKVMAANGTISSINARRFLVP